MSKTKETKFDPFEFYEKDIQAQCPTYKERFILEYVELSTRIKKLKNFVGKIKYAKYAGVEEPKHDCPVDLLEKQIISMQLYRAALEVRAEKYENIELPKIVED